MARMKHGAVDPAQVDRGALDEARTLIDALSVELGFSEPGAPHCASRHDARGPGGSLRSLLLIRGLETVVEYHGRVGNEGRRLMLSPLGTGFVRVCIAWKEDSPTRCAGGWKLLGFWELSNVCGIAAQIREVIA